MGRHLHIVHFSLTKQLAETYISVLLRNFGLSMIGIFLPVYLFKVLSYSVREIIWFYILLSVVTITVSPIVAKLNEKFGCKHMIMISVPFTLAFYMLLDILRNADFLFYFVVLLGGISEAMYWIAFHVNFIKFSDDRHRGEEITLWYVATIFLGVVAPLIGALVLTFASFNILFILVAFLLLGSAIPLFSTREIFSHDDFSLKYIFIRERFRDAFAYVGYGGQAMVEGFVWPFFIFFIVKEYFNLGLIFSIASVFTALITWMFIGRNVDRYGREKFISFGIVFYSVINALRMFAKSFAGVLGLTVLGNVAYDTVDVAFSAKTYSRAEKDPLGYMTFRSIFLSFGKVVILFVPLIASYYVSDFTPYLALKYAFIAVIPFVFLQKLL